MKGNLYMITEEMYGNTIVLTTEVEPVGDGYFRFKNEGEYLFTSKDNIFKFTTPEEYQGVNFAKDCNDINLFTKALWVSKYKTNPRMYSIEPDDFSGYIMNHIRAGEGFNFKRETFNIYWIRAMTGREEPLYIGSKGTLIIGHYMNYHSSVEWDSAISPYNGATFDIIDDTLKYVVSYKDFKDKGVGHSRVANYIYNYISAQPLGVSSRDIEIALRLGHPTVAGRISEMDACGRIKKVGEVKYHSSGKPNTIWSISE